MELRQLHFFVTLAEELNFRRAAERMHIAQPAFSEQIRRLERELGARLFDRTSHYVRLTEAGTLFLEEVVPALAQVDHAAVVAARAGQGVLGSVTVGLTGPAANELTPQILRNFAGRYPAVGLDLREFGFADPSAGLAARAVDVAFVRLPVTEPRDLVVAPLLEEPRVAVMACDHRLAGADSLSAADMAAEPFVTGPRPTGLEDHCPGGPVADSVEAWLSLIAAGCGISLAPASCAHSHGGRGLRFVPVIDAPETTLAVAHRRENAAPVVQAFVAVARAAAGRSAPPAVVLAIA